MENSLLGLIREEQKRRKIPAATLCEGICTEGMYSMMVNEKRMLDRITIKRLLARMGVENGDYEHFLHFLDYDAWIKRMNIINAIEKGWISKAESSIKEYNPCVMENSKTCRWLIEEQFKIFMKLQIARHKSVEEYNGIAYKMYEKAVKKTVSNIDNVDMDKLLLSPLEYCLVLEYKRRKGYSSWGKKWDMYKELISYIDNSMYGKLAKVKLYPKLVVCMYEDMVDNIHCIDCNEQRKINMELLEQCEIALSMLKTRKLMYYMTEILEMRISLLSWMVENSEDIDAKKYESLINESGKQLHALIQTYNEYGICAYMQDDCYLYRESALFCIGTVIEQRRKMLHISRKKLCEGICDERTLMREENRMSVMHQDTFKSLFKRLKLNPDYINFGIVTNEKEDVEMYEELRYAESSFRYDKVKELVSELCKRLPDYPINRQVLTRIDNMRQYRMGEKNIDEYISKLKEALVYTIDIKKISNDKYFYLTNEEIITLYLISEAYKCEGRYSEAFDNIKVLWKYCIKIEEQGIEDGRMGIYELIMEYMGNLFGDMGRYEESNDISDRLIKICLQLKRSHEIHRNIYNKAWNNNERKKKGFDYSAELHRCIYFSQLTGDVNDETFYKEMLSENCGS